MERRERKKKEKSGAVGVGMTAGMCKHCLRLIRRSKAGSSSTCSHSTHLSVFCQLYFAAPGVTFQSNSRNLSIWAKCTASQLKNPDSLLCFNLGILFSFQKRTLNTREKAGSFAV